MYNLTILIGLVAICIVNCAPSQQGKRGSGENKDDHHGSRSSPPLPEGSRPPRPTGTFLPIPEGSRPQRPSGDFKSEQDSSRPPRPTGSFSPFPEGSRPPRPTGDFKPEQDASRPFGVSGLKNSVHPPKSTENGKAHSEQHKTNGDFKSSHPPKH